MELRSLKGCIDLHESQVTILGRQHLLEHFELQSTYISKEQCVLCVLNSSISIVNKGTNPVGVVKGADRRFMLVKGELSFAGRLLFGEGAANNAGSGWLQGMRRLSLSPETPLLCWQQSLPSCWRSVMLAEEQSERLRKRWARLQAPGMVR